MCATALAQSPLPSIRPATPPAPGKTPAGNAAPNGGSAAAPRSPLLLTPAATPSRPVTGPTASRAASVANAAGARAAGALPAAERWVPVTVVARGGGEVGSLSPDDLGLIEDGVRQRVVRLERWPLWLVVVLDVGRQVGPMKQLAIHRQLVYDLLAALGEDDHVALVQYADGVEVIQPWTQDPGEAERALNARFESGLDGALWTSVTHAATEMLADKLGRRAIVVVTDGVDDASEAVSYERARDELRKSATTLHVVNLSRYLDEQIRKQAYGVNGVLNVIQSPSYHGRRKELRAYRERLGEAPPRMLEAATESGGKLWHVAPDEDPATLPVRIWRQLEGQYMASYVPERPEERRPGAAVRSYSVFVRRGDIEARVPPRLYVSVVSPRSAPAGEKLARP
jgi:VWFA-related protein